MTSADPQLGQLQRSVEALAAKVDVMARDMTDMKVSLADVTGKFKGGWAIIILLGSIGIAAAGLFFNIRLHS